MFEKKKCDRCDKQYRGKTISENIIVGGKVYYYCNECVRLCLNCGSTLPYERWFGSYGSRFGNATSWSLQRMSKPHFGSGLCKTCFDKKREQERENYRIIEEAKIKQAKEILETPTVWECPHCDMVNRGNFCPNCGSPRKKKKSTNFY